MKGLVVVLAAFVAISHAMCSDPISRFYSVHLDEHWWKAGKTWESCMFGNKTLLKVVDTAGQRVFYNQSIVMYDGPAILPRANMNWEFYDNKNICNSTFCTISYDKPNNCTCKKECKVFPHVVPSTAIYVGKVTYLDQSCVVLRNSSTELLDITVSSVTCQPFLTKALQKEDPSHFAGEIDQVFSDFRSLSSSEAEKYLGLPSICSL